MEDLADIKAKSIGEWIAIEPVRRTVAKSFRAFLMEFTDQDGVSVYGTQINAFGERMCAPTVWKYCQILTFLRHRQATPSLWKSLFFTLPQPTLLLPTSWRYLFPGFVLGSGGMMAVFTGTNVGVMTSVPPEMAGVAGAVLQVALQVGSAVALSVQAGLLTINPGGLNNFSNVKASFYFEVGWGILWLLAFLAFYRPSKTLKPAEGKGAVAVV